MERGWLRCGCRRRRAASERPGVAPPAACGRSEARCRAAGGVQAGSVENPLGHSDGGRSGGALVRSDASRPKARKTRVGAKAEPAYLIAEDPPPEAPLRTLDAIRDDFAFLDDWEDRYRYVIELGRELPEFPESARTDANKVRGCVSQVWIEDGLENGVIRLRGDSDSHLVKGLVAIATALYDGKTPADALKIDALGTFRDLGLEQHLTPQRSNGVRSMIERIRADAAALAA